MQHACNTQGRTADGAAGADEVLEGVLHHQVEPQRLQQHPLVAEDLFSRLPKQLQWMDCECMAPWGTEKRWYENAHSEHNRATMETPHPAHTTRHVSTETQHELYNPMNTNWNYSPQHFPFPRVPTCSLAHSGSFVPLRPAMQSVTWSPRGLAPTTRHTTTYTRTLPLSLYALCCWSRPAPPLAVA